MSEKPESKRSAKQSESPIDPGALQNAALEIYKSIAINNKSYSPQALAQHSFALAVEFVKEAQRVADGGPIQSTLQRAPVPEVTIIPWKPGTEYGQYGEPLTDEYGRYMTQVVKGDPDTHHPNLPPDHPHNQRFWLARDKMGLEVPERYQSALARHKQLLEEMAS